MNEIEQKLAELKNKMELFELFQNTEQDEVCVALRELEDAVSQFKKKQDEK